MGRALPIFANPPASAAPSRTPAAPKSVRISLTDRCDLACVYCRPSRKDAKLEDRLDAAGLRTLIAGLVRAGIRRVRFTGGEPLLSPHVVEAIAYARELGVDDLALTTNGTRLAELAEPLRKAGLRRLTLSLDSLDPGRFFRITRGGRLDRVLDGLDRARCAGFDEIKLNTVVLRGENDDELESIARFAWKLGLTPRFIEVMPIAEGARIVGERLVPAREMFERLSHLLIDEPARVDRDRGPAKYVRSRVVQGARAGFITGTTDTFCEGCDRLRASADGVLRPCLARDDGVAAGDAARLGSVHGVVRMVGEAWLGKPDGRSWRGCTEPTAAQLSMRAIGG